ncbi:hypothetical protein LINPERHAP2_LOCUS44296 [Linum perenne]
MAGPRLLVAVEPVYAVAGVLDRRGDVELGDRG